MLKCENNGYISSSPLWVVNGGTTIFTRRVGFYVIHTVHTTVPELYPHFGFGGCRWTTTSEDSSNPNRRPHAARRGISSIVLTFCRFMDSSFCFSMFHRTFFTSIIDKHQHMHFFTFKTVLV